MANLGALCWPVHRCLRSSSWRSPLVTSLSQSRGICGRPPGAAARSNAASSGEPASESQFLQTILSGVLAPYWENTPSALAAIELLEDKYPDACIGFDHFAFRTYGLPHLGIHSVASVFQDFGYSERDDELHFPAKKLRARWYSPPVADLPRIFVSELQVEQLSTAAQAVIRKYCGDEAGPAVMGRHCALSTVLGVLPWETPTKDEYDVLAKESEYAAWVLTNGYALNHTTVAVHRLDGVQKGIEEVNHLLQDTGFLLNESGGVLKVSPDGLLLQSSTMADRISFVFADGESHLVPGSYVEFAERLVLPQFRDLPAGQLQEHHRRDGFETGNADTIFESTYEKK